MNKTIDLVSYRADLQRKIEAIDVLLGGSVISNGHATHRTNQASNGTRGTGRRKMSAAGRARIAAGARARWAKVKVKGAGRNNKTGATTNEVILKALAGRRDVATKVIKAACVKAGKSGNAVSVAINALRKNGKVRKGSQTGFWKLA